MTTLIQTSWNFSEPSDAQQQYDIQLLTIGGVSVLGRWHGRLGEFYIGWVKLLGASISQLQPYHENTDDEDYYVRPFTTTEYAQ